MRDRIGKFEILQPLGHGAMGDVYLAKDPMIGRHVAIKVIRQDALQLANRQEVVRERFFREARAAGGLNHRNIVTVHEFGEDGDLLYLAMEFVDGEDLGTLLEQGNLTSVEKLEILAQVCDGLAHAHAKGVLHRDIKPSNIRVTLEDGKLLAKVMDFGIARQGGSDLTGTGTLVGTFSYMAPEYIQGGKASASSDLFAVGVILYEALAGKRAFQGDSGATLLYAIVHHQPERLAPARIEGLSPAVQSLVDRALAKDPAWRLPDAAAFAAALRAAKDPAWPGLQDWQEDATREAPKPRLPVGPVRPAPPATPAPPPAPGRQAPVILTREPEPESSRALLWPAAGVVLGLTVGGLWMANRRGAGRPPSPAAPFVPQAPARTGPAATPASPGPVPPVQGGEPPPAEALPRLDATRPEGPAGGPPGAPPDGGRPRDPEAFEAGLRLLESDPEGALAEFERALRGDPAHVPSHATRLYALFRLNRTRDLKAALDEAAAAGVTPARMEGVPHYRRLLEEARRTRRLPPDLLGALVQGLPLPDRTGGGPPGT
ncbi:MAG: protein kinase [Holophagaceae bacterium]